MKRRVSGIMLSLILMSLLSFLTELSMEHTGVSEKVTASLVADYENVTTHEGDLTINGTQNFLVENCVYVQNGDVYVNDQSNLTIKNAKFVMEERYFREFRIWIDDIASVLVDDAEIFSIEGFGLHVKGNATASFRNGLVEEGWIYSHDSASMNMLDTKIKGHVGLYDKSGIILSNCTIEYGLELIFSEGYIEIDSLQRGFISYWSLKNITAIGSKLNVLIANSTISEINVAFRGSPTAVVTNSTIDYLPISEKSAVTIWNCTVGTLVLTIGESAQKLFANEIKPGFFVFWNLHRNLTTFNVDFNITLFNSKIDGWRFEAGSGEISITNSELYVLSSYDDSKTSIVNSTVIVIYSNRGNPAISVLDSKVGLMHLSSLSPNVHVCNSSIEELDCWHESAIYLNGTVNIGIQERLSSVGLHLYDSAKVMTQDASVYIFCNITLTNPQALVISNSNVTRSFSVRTLTKINNTVPSTLLILHDDMNATVWNGLTDSYGEICFNVTFSESNYRTNFRLFAAKNDWSAEKDIDLIGDTPIIMTLEFSSDIRGDGKVSIQDITIVAIAYKSKPGDPNWNSLADIDKNSVIDILDITKVAVDYGKTV